MAADAPSKGLRSLTFERLENHEDSVPKRSPVEHIPKCAFIAIDSSEQASGGGPSIIPTGPQYPHYRAARPSGSFRTVLIIIPGDAAGPIGDGSSWPPGGRRQSPKRAGASSGAKERHFEESEGKEGRDRAGESKQEKVEIAAEEVPVPTLHHSRLVMMGRVTLCVRLALARRRAQPVARDFSAQNLHTPPSPVTMSGLIFYDFGESFSFSRDFTDIPPPPNPATFHHVDVPIIERNYSSEDDSNVIRNPTFTADGQPSWLASMNVDQPLAYTPVEDPLGVPPNVLRDRHRTGRPRSNSARQPAHAMAYHPYSPPSSPELPADVPLPSERHSWPPRAGRATRGLVPYPPSDASSRDSSPERPSWRARGAAVTYPAPSAYTSPTPSAAPSTSTAPTPSTPPSTSTAPPALAAPATPTIPRRRRKRSSKKPASDLDVVIAGMSALGVGDSDADVDDLVRSMRTMRLKTRRARRRVAN
ncbi:uncharacterized protein SCHCODRAFT_02519603 [Schizophyllum commune H4-8]|nr:uncharacterized protein SCHCODRAFT_02519603 [Schizophyllum commune H4-8]KAI5885912.1 hypothetical protein SCHCODRAFT_02519603 [Schizophyllum commune H4-8]